MENKIIEISGLWVQQTKDGRKYMSGSMGKTRILVFKNDKKGNENAPDYRLCIAENRRREDGSPPPADPTEKGGKTVPTEPYPGDDNLPF